MTKSLEFTLLNQASEIARLQDELEMLGRQHGLAPRVLHAAELALEEHLTNVMAYAYETRGEHRIQVRVQIGESELRIEVEDDGRPFNPLKQPAPDLSLALEERRIGGLGIHMMRQSLDAMEYRRERDRNLLVMIKRL
jgi:anti-sigma regulatory factor (Ser/Thr protein kinase)